MTDMHDDRLKFRVRHDTDEPPEIVSFRDLLSGMHSCHPVSLVSVEQCSGEKDSKGDLIFDGDILNSPEDACEVKFYKGCFGVQIQYDCIFLPLEGFKKCFWDEVEIIGNTQDNPELLEDR